jgi:hypothetical protein
VAEFSCCLLPQDVDVVGTVVVVLQGERVVKGEQLSSLFSLSLSSP